MAISWLDLHVEVDWFGTGFATAADLIGDTLRFSTTRGMSTSPMQGFVAQTGQASVMLRNLTGDYAADNPAGPYYGFIKDHVPIRFRVELPDLMIDQVIWSGRVDKIRGSGQVGGVPTVTLTCVGNLMRLSDGRKVTPEPSPGDTTDVLLESLLVAAGLTSSEYSLATGEIESGVWGPVNIDPLAEARLVVATELGRLYEAKDGVLTFENRHYRRDTTRSNSVQLTLSDDPGDDDDDRYRQVDENDPAENQYDRVAINFIPTFTLDDEPVTIFLLGGPAVNAIVVPPNGSRKVTIAPFAYPFVFSANSTQAETPGTYYVTEWVDPTVSGVDPDLLVDTAYAAQTSLSISNIVTTTHSITFTLSNSDPATNIVMDIVRLIGRRGVTGAPVQEVVGAGVREYPLPSPYYPSAGPANTAARWLYDYWNPPRKLVTLDLPPLRSAALFADLLAREISDRVTITATGSRTQLSLDADFFWEGESWSFAQNGPLAEIGCQPWFSACLPNTHDSDDDTGLPTGMNPYYTFEAASGPIADVVGTYDLGNHGSTAVVGIIGRARDFDAASNQYALNSSAGIPDTDYANSHEWDGWIKDGGAWSPDQIVLQKDIGEDFAYRVFVHESGGDHIIRASITTDDGVFTNLGSATILDDGEWHFWRFVHDADLLRFGTSVDMSPFSYETYTGTPLTFTDGLVLGGTGSSGGGGTPTPDSTDSDPRELTISPATSHTVSFTNSGGNFLLVGITYGRTLGHEVTSITYDGAPLTFLQGPSFGGGANDMHLANTQYMAVGYLVAPSTGTHDLVFTFAGDSVSRITVGAQTFSGINPLTPYSAVSYVQNSSSTAISNTIASATGELVVDVVGTGMGLFSTRVITAVGAGQTQQYNLQDANVANGTNGAGSYEAGAASVTMSWTIDSAIGWVSVALSLQGAGGSLLPLNCAQDELGYMAGRILTDAEADERWNGGAGSTADGGGGTPFVPVVPSTPVVPIPSGGTADRPGAPIVNQYFFDTDLGQLIYWDGDSWEPAADPVGSGISADDFTAKGDLLVGSGVGAFGILAVGLDGQVLTADSTQALGVRWEDLSILISGYSLDFSVASNSMYLPSR